MKVIVLSSVLKQKHRDQISGTASQVGADVCFVNSEKEIPEEFRDAEVLYGFGTETAKTSTHLKWLAVPSAGVDFLMKESAFANPNCILTNSSGAYGVTIAEHIMGVTLMMMRGLLEFAEETRAGKWSTPRQQRSIKDCRIMVLGTGDIGRAFAARAKAFEPEAIIGVCRSGMAPARLFNRVVKIDEIEKWLPRTDLLVMSLPDTPQTVNILSRKRINMLPQGAYVVNVGRGSAIDEDALADALEEGRLGGAALDVFRTEPLPEDSRLWKTKNLLITPHVAGGLTLDYTLDKNVEMFCEDLRNYAEKRPLLHRVSRKKGY